MLDSPLDGVDQDGHQEVIPVPCIGYAPPPGLPNTQLTPGQVNAIRDWASDHFSNFGPSFVWVIRHDTQSLLNLFRKSKTPMPDAGSKRGGRRPSADVRAKADKAATDSSGKLRCSYCGQELTTEPGKPNSR